ncbi:hypothetical protein Acsp03_13800 [Actinomadura sp. NBRC 104412]|uniref:hypothetical protein n=1 Tax=Actinomadura sp. NBRC 104412 TaxID=3032203 RepID=UPI0024A45129|nr:hypothetical protein [Actinomadura sp. NBRC 104412]GLZ03914.1 hypothetical protein Acsp03_13800 [Actinomadura sp. NBRC 104412]
MTDRSSAAGSGAASTAKANRQIARLRALLKEREGRVQELERRLIALEKSTTVQFGRLVAGAARAPKRRGTKLPRELYRLWRKRNVPAVEPTVQRSGKLELDDVERPEDRLLVSQPYDGLIIAGVLGRETAALLGEHAKVISLYPHDAITVLDTADADLLVVDAAAGEPGGPWAYLGVPGMYDRDRVLMEVRRKAAERGLPLVLWGEAPPPTLAVLKWDARVTAASELAKLTFAAS